MLLAAFAVFSIASYAQCSFGGQVGANLGMGQAKFNYAGYALTNDPKVGFLIGVVAQVDFGKLSFRPELNFVQKGSKSGITYGGFYDDYSSKRTLNYIEVPLNVTYNMDLGPGKLFFGLGPAVGIGLSGTDKDSDGKTKIKFDGLKYDDYDSDADDENGHLKRVDVGLNILAGYQLPMGVFAKIGYTHGFSNVDPNKGNSDPDERSTYKNRGVSICVGYMFGGGGKKKK